MDLVTLPEMATSAEPIARRLVDWLRHAIVTMRIRPGEKLSEQDLARRFGVSRQPVREAFIKLAESGLVRVLPQRGTMVVKISIEAVEDARFIREAIECAVAREAARRGDARALADVRACLEDAAEAMAGGDTERFFALDEEFHQRLAAAAGRPNSWRVVEEQKAQMDRVRYLDMSDAIPMKTVMAQHLAILAAVDGGDERAAETAMRVHLTEILVSLPKIAARWPDLFEGHAEAGDAGVARRAAGG
ncbi:GntR family transcriptional regulator [Pinisolibacter sp.]|uniref:GntR family transcriptional regulator n=1 Tax=Pinisolibacter sp. TaxID=2172024 RepID=UPI002FDCCA96